MRLRAKSRSRLRLLVAGLVAALVVPLSPVQARADEVTILDKGHVDAFNVSVVDGQLLLDLKEDFTGSHVRRDPEQVELHVKSRAEAEIPQNFPGHPRAYLLPATQDHELLWPGWDTLGTVDGGFDQSIDIVFDSVEGPGEIHLFQTDAFGSGYVPLLLDGGTLVSGGAIRRQDFPAHTHANWIFTAPGIYTLKVKAVGVKNGQRQQTDTKTYKFTVGDEYRGQAYQQQEELPDLTPTPAPTQTSGPEQSQSPEPETSPEPTQSVSPSPEQSASVVPPSASPTQEPSTNPTQEPTAGPQLPTTEPSTVPKPSIAPKPSAVPKPSTPPEGGQSATEQRLVLDQGHVDAFNVVARAGKLTLNLKEDVTGQHVTRVPSSVELHVKSRAFTDQIPAGWPGSPKAYFLPMVQAPDLLWPGWDTSGTQGGGVDPEVKLRFREVSGPGEVHVFSQSAFGGLMRSATGLQPLLDGGQTQLSPGAAITVAQPAHVHANWVFTAPGVYRLTVVAEGHSGGQTVSSSPENYVITVGDEYRGQGEAVGSGGVSGTQKGTTVGSGTGTSGGGPVGSGVLAPNTGGVAQECKPNTTVREATQAEIAAALRGVGQGGGGQAEGSATIPANTHAHPNWVFSAPGEYTLTIRQTTKSNSGQQLSATATLRFRVGSDGAGANSGHFDFGAQIQDGKLVAMIKDDRQPPAKWVSPSSLTFIVGSAAKATAPAGIEFIADQGQPVWMIAASQVAGVPWLGVNTQHESLLQGSSAEVTYSLVSASGPGNVGVFTSGNFGKVVGQRWFTRSVSSAPSATAGGKITLTEEKATAGQVFVKDDKHFIKEVKWTYPNGAECKPGSGLPRSGVSRLTDDRDFSFVLPTERLTDLVHRELP